jgi:hypothetical protein
MKKLLLSALALGLVLGLVISAQADSFFDNFNRSDSPNLGPNWTTSGSIGIASNQAASTNEVANFATVNGFSQSYLTTRLSVDAVSTSTTLNYVALILGYADAAHNIFVKVQNQSDLDNQYHHAAFYYGNNGGGNFFLLDTPFAQGRISVYALDADTIRLDIDSNFDDVADQFYTWDYSAAQIATLGTGIGLGMYGQALADNYAANYAAPLPGTLLLLGPGLIGLAVLRRKFRG